MYSASFSLKALAERASLYTHFNKHISLLISAKLKVTLGIK